MRQEAGDFVFAAASTALLPDDNAVKDVIQSLYDPLYVIGAGGLGASLVLIHIYVTPIKRTLQVLWAVGALGSLGIAVNFAAPANQGLVEFVLHNPAGIWAVGPLFASLTGLVFKEGKSFISCVLIFLLNTLLAFVNFVRCTAHVFVSRAPLTGYCSLNQNCRAVLWQAGGSCSVLCHTVVAARSPCKFPSRVARSSIFALFSDLG